MEVETHRPSIAAYATRPSSETCVALRRMSSTESENRLGISNKWRLDSEITVELSISPTDRQLHIVQGPFTPTASTRVEVRLLT